MKTKTMTCEGVLSSPEASYWIKNALSEAIKRDPIDAANDAEFLAQLLRARMFEVLKR